MLVSLILFLSAVFKVFGTQNLTETIQSNTTAVNLSEEDTVNTVPYLDDLSLILQAFKEKHNSVKDFLDYLLDDNPDKTNGNNGITLNDDAKEQTTSNDINKIIETLTTSVGNNSFEKERKLQNQINNETKSDKDTINKLKVDPVMNNDTNIFYNKQELFKHVQHENNGPIFDNFKSTSHENLSKKTSKYIGEENGCYENVLNHGNYRITENPLNEPILSKSNIPMNDDFSNVNENAIQQTELYDRDVDTLKQILRTLNPMSLYESTKRRNDQKYLLEAFAKNENVNTIAKKLGYDLNHSFGPGPGFKDMNQYHHDFMNHISVTPPRSSEKSMSGLKFDLLNNKPEQLFEKKYANLENNVEHNPQLKLSTWNVPCVKASEILYEFENNIPEIPDYHNLNYISNKRPVSYQASEIENQQRKGDSKINIFLKATEPNGYKASTPVSNTVLYENTKQSELQNEMLKTVNRNKRPITKRVSSGGPKYIIDKNKVVEQPKSEVYINNMRMENNIMPFLEHRLTSQDVLRHPNHINSPYIRNTVKTRITDSNNDKIEAQNRVHCKMIPNSNGLDSIITNEDTLAVLFKPQTISFMKSQGNLLKNTVMDVLVPFHISKVECTVSESQNL